MTTHVKHNPTTLPPSTRASTTTHPPQPTTPAEICKYHYFLSQSQGTPFMKHANYIHAYMYAQTLLIGKHHRFLLKADTQSRPHAPNTRVQNTAMFPHFCQPKC